MKFAVVGLSQSVRAEFESEGIAVSVLCPDLVIPAEHLDIVPQRARWERAVGRG